MNVKEVLFMNKGEGEGSYACNSAFSGLVDEEKLDSFNVPYYTPSREEVEDIVQREGSFAIEEMEILELADGDEQEKDMWAKGEKIANNIRSFTESIIVHHFGEEILENLFGKLTRIVVDDLAKASTQAIRPFELADNYTVWSALVLEIVMTFGLVYTVYATAIDPQRGSNDTIAPIAIGFIVGANILAGGAFSGASMNPAIAFGPAVVSGSGHNHWVYWIGPLLGGGLAGFTFEAFMTRPPLKSPVPR
ncbi:hypothetical protein L1049_012085 [Liquidambar formosana]|uniref:Uncharacterized protein n=1 Tax=Liquidambar formosana TaxID=63359 RepID=A0AAP0RXK7_LIQFO